jgi:hypothetical protein
MAAKPVFKPSQVLRLVRKGMISDSQPGTVHCEEKRHLLECVTESPTFWENGTYGYCPQCGKYALMRAEFATFEIDMTGERKVYPMYMDDPHPN